MFPETSIELNDQFSDVVYGIINSVNLAITAMEDMQQSMNSGIEMNSLQRARNEISQATMAVSELDTAMKNVEAPVMTVPSVDTSKIQVINVDVNPVLPNPLVENQTPVKMEMQPNAPPEPISIPAVWNSGSMEIFTGTGIERFQQEVRSGNSLAQQLYTTQDAIAKQAYNTVIFSPEAFKSLNSMAVRIDNIRDRIQQIGNSSANMGTGAANTELEQLRFKLSQAVEEQKQLNAAVEGMNISDANAAYMRLSQTVGSTEQYIRDNVDEQGRFNAEVSIGVPGIDKITNALKSLTAHLNIENLKKALNISDELTMTMSGLNAINDGAQTTQELFNMIYASARNTHTPLMNSADAVIKMGNSAKDAFSSNAELVAFMDQANKQFAIGGASTAEQSDAMQQLTQAMATGTLGGAELNSILAAAPGIASAIEESMGWAEGSLESYAEKGAVTAEIVKASLLNAADETNATFEALPTTFAQSMTDFKNDALMVFQPVLQRLDEIANSEGFQSFIDNIVQAMSFIANIVLIIMDLVGQVAAPIVDNWSVISPLIYGIIAALALFTAALIIQTVAQWAMNAAMLACPLMWIIILIIALIAVIFQVCNYIANMTGIANSGFGIIAGGINVVIQLYKNLRLTILNIVLGMVNAMVALAINMITAFRNAIRSIQSFFYNLLSTALVVIAGICEALNKLPFVEIDYSGITSKAGEYAEKAVDLEESKEEYKSISDAFHNMSSTFDTFQDGWMSDAFNDGAAWGDGIAERIENFEPFDRNKLDMPDTDDLYNVDIPGADDYSSMPADIAGGTGAAETVDSIAEDTSNINDSLDVSEDDLRYLRDIAEQEAINRYTTAEIKIDAPISNNISSNMDLDGVLNVLNEALGEAAEIAAEGVHM